MPVVTETRDCDDCDMHNTVRQRNEPQKFQYGETELHTDMPVWRCGNCDSAYFEEDGEIARAKSVKRLKGGSK